MHLHHSVGPQSPNDSVDVKHIQQLLNQAGALDSTGKPLAVDGAPGKQTLEAIKGFQRDVVGTANPDGKVDPGRTTLTKLVWTAEEFSLFVATIYGEAGNSSEAAWNAIAWVIMNRMGTREWSAFQTAKAVIRNTGFDAYTQKTAPYHHAMAAMKRRSLHHQNPVVERIIRIVRPVYLSLASDPTSGAVLYYSPKAQAALHKANPSMYKRESPPWKFELLKQVSIPGLTSLDDFKFYAYK
jgi:hypothetical protein